MSEPTENQAEIQTGNQAEKAGELVDWSEPMHVDRYERIWLRASIFILVIFVLAVVVSSAAFGVQVPGVYARINPTTLLTDPDSQFADPGVRELAPGKYEVTMRAQIWSFVPNEVRIPRGATVTFYITSQDVQHGFIVEKTNLNVMLLPGQISKLTTRFDEPGSYNIICHEYCGLGHHTMFATIIVE